MNALSKHHEAEVIPADETSILAIIGRAASDPATDMDKLERLLGLYERVSSRNAEQAFNEALNGAQAELSPVAADASNPQTKSKYASYPALDRAVRPIYAKHGFSLSFDTDEAHSPDSIRVLCHVAHKDGHSRTYRVDMPADGKGAKGGDVMTKTHATGAAMSYGQRYLLKLIFNIAVGEDRDGNDPKSPRDASAAAQAATAAINECQTAVDLKNWKAKNAEGIKALPADEADEVIRLWNQRAKAIKERAQ